MRRAWVGLAALSIVGACGSDEDRTVAECTASASAALECEAPLDVATSSDVEREIAKLAEIVDGTTETSSGAALRPSRDVRATADVEIDIATLHGAPESCTTPASGCVETWAFSGERTAPIVSFFSAPTTPLPLPSGASCADGERCTKLKIAAGTVVRFQRVLEPYRFAQRFSHFVRVVRPCAAECAADELRCGASSTCLSNAKVWSKELALCRLCEGKPAAECACRIGCSLRDDEASCSFARSDDVSTSGTCNAGVCQGG